MNTSFGIGKKLIISFSIILFLTVLSVLIANHAINRIDDSKDQLVHDSIPALISANDLSITAVKVIQGSLQMNMSENIEELKAKRQATLSYSNRLSEQLDILEKANSSTTQVDHVDSVLGKIQDNIMRRSKLIQELLELQNTLNNEIVYMNSAITSLKDSTALMKIEADIVLSEAVQNIKENNVLTHQNIIALLDNELVAVKSALNMSSRLDALERDLQNLTAASDRNHLLSIQQDFDHALRNIIRAIVKIEDDAIKDKLSVHIDVLIRYGQDTPDIFQEQIQIINLKQSLEKISNQNITLTEELNDGVKNLSTNIDTSTEIASKSLDSTVSFARTALISIAFISIIVSLLIIWFFIYKNIITKLSYLSLVTKKLSKEQYDFDIDKSGESELSDIATALDSLKDRSIETKRFNKILSEKSLQLERSNEDLTQFAYVASHDLQEPLRMIGSYVQLLEKKYSGKIDAEADKYIGFAVQGCVRMRALIEGLLAFSRVDSNQDKMEVVIANDILDDVLNDLTLMIKEKQATVHVHKLSDIFAVSSQVYDVFKNLISNAIKYCDDIPEIFIESNIVDGMVRFSVKDNGIGINEKYKNKIFIIFKRLHSREAYSGTGIGLSVCKKIIERHGGRIWFESKLGEGTSFYFTFPVARDVSDTYDKFMVI